MSTQAKLILQQLTNKHIASISQILEKTKSETFQKEDYFPSYFQLYKKKCIGCFSCIIAMVHFEYPTEKIQWKKIQYEMLSGTIQNCMPHLGGSLRKCMPNLDETILNSCLAKLLTRILTNLSAHWSIQYSDEHKYSNIQIFK